MLCQDKPIVILLDIPIALLLPFGVSNDHSKIELHSFQLKYLDSHVTSHALHEPRQTKSTMAPSNGEIVPGSVYLYQPVKWAPPRFAAWFAVATIAHVWQCFKYKAWKVTGLHPFCGLLFTAGFVVRSCGAYNYENIGAYVASSILILCAP